MTPEAALRVAEAWAADGVGAFPVAIGWSETKGATDKRPLTHHGHCDATTDRAELARMFKVCAGRLHPGEEMGVGVHPGSAGLVTLDFDTKGGKGGGETLKRLLEEHPDLAICRYHSCSGALNVVVHKPPGMGPVANVVPVGWHGTDVRGDNGWIVAPGTITSWGEWRWDEGSVPVAEAWQLAPELARLLREAKEGHRPATSKEMAEFIASTTGYTETTRTLVDEHIAALAAVDGQAGNRHPTLVTTLGRIVGLTHVDLRDALDRVQVEWNKLTVGEGREREPMEVLAWVVGQERAKARAALGETVVDPLAEVWSARRELSLIRQAAHSRLVSAYAVLFDIFGRVVAHVPPTVTLPPSIGSKASLNLIQVHVAPSGAGKSSAHDVAREFLVVVDGPEVREHPPGSGEGLAEVFMGVVTEDDGFGKRIKVRRQVRHHAAFYADEGVVLAEMSGRSGSTLLSQLRTAWTGGLLGQANASAETHRVLAAHSYRLCFTLGIQSGNAGALFADTVSGTPQRLLWASASDPTLPERAALAPEWPGELLWTPPQADPLGQYVEVPTRIALEVGDEHARRHRDRDSDPLDAHLMLLRLKVAAALGLLDHRLAITEEDWQLSDVLLRYSTAVRDTVRSELEQEARRQDETAVQRAVRRAEAIDTNADVRARESAVKSAARKIVKHAENDEHLKEGGGCTRSCVILAVASKHRALVSADEIIDLLVHRGLSEERGGRLWPGKVKP